MARKSSVASFSIWSAPIVSKVCHIIMCTYVISSYVRMSNHHVYICHIIMCIYVTSSCVISYPHMYVCHIIMCIYVKSNMCHIIRRMCHIIIRMCRIIIRMCHTIACSLFFFRKITVCKLLCYDRRI